MGMRNQVQLIGNVGNNPELTTLEGGRKTAKISLATHEMYRDATGSRVTETTWHNLVAWGKKAEVISKYVSKGTEIAITGKLTSRTFTDKEGNKRHIAEIIVDEILLLGQR